MTIHTIRALLSGPIDPALEYELADSLLPMTLRPVERANDRAPDFRIDIAGKRDLGFGWSEVSPTSAIPYVAILIAYPEGKHIQGVAFQLPNPGGRWLAQLHSIEEVGLQS